MTILLFSISIIGMLLLPLILAVALRRRFVVAWYLFCVGMATFVGSQIVHLPLNEWLADIGLIGPISVDAPDFVRTAVVLGFSAAICETAGRAIGYWILFRYRAAEKFEDSIMVGLGHGGIEAMLFGAVLTAASITSLLALQGTDLQSLGLSLEQITAVNAQLEAVSNTPYVAFANLIERGAALTLHVGASVLVWLSFKRRNPLYALAALLLHALFDTTAVFISQYLDNFWLIEGIMVLLALGILLWLWRAWPSQTAQPERRLNSVGTDWHLFTTAVKKEFKMQWRTKRIFIVCAVFILFGLMSPLLAKFTPELISSLEGAEMFADLIPVPTTADAIAQYIKNLTQFGFILVIVLGMGAVAAEKDKGTATMILSKPLTRWSFLMSKFLAQAAVYFLALMLGAVGAYYYTQVLFGGLAFGPFIVGNVLLWLWLLVFAAATLLSSTIANNTAVAAGIAFLLAVILLMAGSIPTIGPLMPSGLVAWAGQLGLAGDIAANGGAVVMAIVLVLVSLITATAVFEQQEL